MGYYNDSRGIRCFEPDNDENTLWLWSCYPMDTLMERIREHFGTMIQLNELTIRGERINTRCIGYDLYDPSDYDDYICIQRTK